MNNMAFSQGSVNMRTSMCIGDILRLNEISKFRQNLNRGATHYQLSRVIEIFKTWIVQMSNSLAYE